MSQCGSQSFFRLKEDDESESHSSSLLPKSSLTLFGDSDSPVRFLQSDSCRMEAACNRKTLQCHRVSTDLAKITKRTVSLWAPMSLEVQHSSLRAAGQISWSSGAFTGKKAMERALGWYHSRQSDIGSHCRSKPWKENWWLDLPIGSSFLLRHIGLCAC